MLKLSSFNKPIINPMKSYLNTYIGDREMKFKSVTVFSKVIKNKTSCNYKVNHNDFFYENLYAQS